MVASVRELTRIAVGATAHCLTGCAIGEVLGIVIGTALGWGNLATIVLAVVLAFVFGYALTIRSVLATGLSFATAVPIALASDTVSIAGRSPTTWSWCWSRAPCTPGWRTGSSGARWSPASPSPSSSPSRSTAT